MTGGSGGALHLPMGYHRLSAVALASNHVASGRHAFKQGSGKGVGTGLLGDEWLVGKPRHGSGVPWASGSPQVRYVSFVDSSSIVFINGRKFLLIHQMLLVKVGPATLGQTSVSRATPVGVCQQPKHAKISFSTPGIALAGIRKLSPSNHALTQPTLHPGHLLCLMTTTRPKLFAHPPAHPGHLLEVTRQPPRQSRIPTHPLNHPFTS